MRRQDPQETSPIIKTIVDKRGGNAADGPFDVDVCGAGIRHHAEVIAELNKKMKTVEVQKVTLADVKKKAAEAAAKQPAKPAEKPKKK